MIIKQGQPYEEYLKECGFSSDEIKEKVLDREYFKKQLERNKGREQREVTSSTYEMAQKRLFKKVESFLSGK